MLPYFFHGRKRIGENSCTVVLWREIADRDQRRGIVNKARRRRMSSRKVSRIFVNCGLSTDLLAAISSISAIINCRSLYKLAYHNSRLVADLPISRSKSDHLRYRLLRSL